MADPTRLIKDTWTFMRAAVVPVVADDDWRLTNDVTAFLAGTELLSIVPKLGAFGGFQLSLEWLDVDGKLVIPAANSRLTVEILELSKIPAFTAQSVTAKTILMRATDDITLQGEQLVSNVIGTFKQDIGLRLVSSQSEPVGATSLVIMGRYS